MVIKNYLPKSAPQPGEIRTAAAVAYFLIFCLLTLLLQACAPAKLTHVLIDDRPANQSEYFKVQIFHKEKQIETKKDLDLQEESVIETDAQSWAVLRFRTSDAMVIMKPNTRVQIGSFHLIFGEIMAVIDKVPETLPLGFFSVITEDVEAGPQHTVFTVRKDRDGPTTVRVIRGTVKLTSPSEAWKPVLINQYQQAGTSLAQPPKISTMTKGDYNQIVDWGNRIELAINPLDALIIVPHIEALQETKARALLKDAGLQAGVITPKITPSGRTAIGTVVEQQPSPGVRVRKGTAVNMAVEVKPVTVPQLINKPLGQAKNLLVRRDLQPGKVERRITGKAPAESVIDQQPASGKIVPEGTLVNLVVEEESVLVPNVQGLNKNQAMSILSSGRLTVSKWEEQITGRQPPHTILQQDPGPNTRVRPGTGVTLVEEAVSVLVPNLVGYQRSNAIGMLRQNNLMQGQVTEQITGRQPPGTILAQQPAAGQRVKPNSQVQLEIEAQSVVVPNLINFHRNAAQSTLNTLNLRIGRISEELRDQVNDNTVLYQSPPSGQRVALQTPIDITVAIRGVRVPQLSGQTQAAAIGTLGKYNLRVGGISQGETGRYNWGNVIGQNPPANSLVRQGTGVNLVIGVQPKCYVPGVVGMSVVDAENAIRAARLTPYNSSRITATGARVSTQNPAPGMQVGCGTTVSFQAILIMQQPPNTVPSVITTPTINPGILTPIPRTVQ
jgi:beta-lactam-binding protein with PASTA domain